MNQFAGRRILIGRDAGRAAGLIAALAQRGATAVAEPLVEVSFQVGTSELDQVLLSARAGEIDWFAFTSVNAVSAVVRRATELQIREPIPASTRIAAVGPATADALTANGFPVDLVPTAAGTGAALGAAFPTAAAVGAIAVLPQAELASPDLAQALAAKRYQVRPVVAYRTVPRCLPESVQAQLTGTARPGFDVAVLTSSSAVAALPSGVRVPLVCIGEPTANTLRRNGIEPAAVAAQPTDAGLLAAIQMALGGGLAQS